MRAWLLLLLVFVGSGQEFADDVANQTDTTPQEDNSALADENQAGLSQANVGEMRSALSENPMEQALLLTMLLGQDRTQRNRRSRGGGGDILNTLLLLSLLKGGESTTTSRSHRNEAKSLSTDTASRSAPLLQQLALQSMLNTNRGEPQTCEGLCGRPMLARACGCDRECEAQGDCCPDYDTLCREPTFVPPTQPVIAVPQTPVFVAPPQHLFTAPQTISPEIVFPPVATVGTPLTVPQTTFPQAESRPFAQSPLPPGPTAQPLSLPPQPATPSRLPLLSPVPAPVPVTQSIPPLQQPPHTVAPWSPAPFPSVITEPIIPLSELRQHVPIQTSGLPLQLNTTLTAPQPQEVVLSTRQVPVLLNRKRHQQPEVNLTTPQIVQLETAIPQPPATGTR